jgi:hypothetical protein
VVTELPLSGTGGPVVFGLCHARKQCQPAPLDNENDSIRQNTLGPSAGGRVPMNKQLSFTWAYWIATTFLILGYAGFLVTHGESIAGGSDSSGYFNSAKLLEHGRLIDSIRTIEGLGSPDWHYYYQQPLGYSVMDESPAMVPTYPIGLPLMLLAGSWVAGWEHTAILVNVLCALGSGLMVALLGRDYFKLRGPWILASVTLLWFCPLFVFFSLQPMSDMPATFWVLLIFYASARSPNSIKWSMVAGAAMGMAVLVRPTNLLVGIPVAVLVGLNWRSWLAIILGGLPFAILQAAYNHQLYGDVFASGYGNIFALFKTDYARHNIVHFAHWIPRLLTPVVLLALGLPWFVRQMPRMVTASALWIIILIGFYAFYYHSGETWWYLRFILPCFPILILAATMSAQHLTDRWRSHGGRIAIAVLFTVLTGAHLVQLCRQLYVTDVKRTETAYFNVTRWLETQVPDNSIIAAMQASGALHYYTKFPLLRYDLMPPEDFTRAAEIARAQDRPIYAPLFPFELEEVVEAKLGGTWEKVATIDYITIWRLQP